LYSLSRVFFFPATMSRPDMLCCLWGLGALSSAWAWSFAPTRRKLVLTGVLCGLGLLTHPFAIVYCLQIGVWVLWASGGWKRSVTNGAVLTGVALLVFALWLPLILIDTDAFREQFVANVFHRAGPGFVGRVLWPWPYFREQSGLMWEHSGAWQFLLMLAGLAYVGFEAVRRRTSAVVTLTLLAGSSVYLMVACLGLHPAKGYWCYPGALLMICVARMLTGVSRESVRRPTLLRAGVWSAALLVMLPGAGLRTWIAHVGHWNDDNYNSFRFARQIAGRFAPEERLLVDPAFVFDVWLVHPHVLLASQTDSYFRAEQFEFDWLIISRYGLDNDLPGELGTRAATRLGSREDLFACYAEVHAPQGQSAVEPVAVRKGIVRTDAGAAQDKALQADGGASHSPLHVPF
jgi:hypothetical protein